MTAINLAGSIALVTGATRGVGHGVAVGLARAGATVYATGRSIAGASFDVDVRRVTCDHTDDAAVATVFDSLDREAGTIDILVNVAWGGYERMLEDGRFAWVDPFWKQSRWRWDAMMTAGVRAAYVARLACRRTNGRAQARPDRAHLVVGRTEASGQRGGAALPRPRPTRWRPTWRTSSGRTA